MKIEAVTQRDSLVFNRLNQARAFITNYFLIIRKKQLNVFNAVSRTRDLISGTGSGVRCFRSHSGHPWLNFEQYKSFYRNFFSTTAILLPMPFINTYIHMYVF